MPFWLKAVAILAQGCSHFGSRLLPFCLKTVAFLAQDCCLFGPRLLPFWLMTVAIIASRGEWGEGMSAGGGAKLTGDRWIFAVNRLATSMPCGHVKLRLQQALQHHCFEITLKIAGSSIDEIPATSEHTCLQAPSEETTLVFPSDSAPGSKAPALRRIGQPSAGSTAPPRGRTCTQLSRIASARSIQHRCMQTSGNRSLPP